MVHRKAVQSMDNTGKPSQDVQQLSLWDGPEIQAGSPASPPDRKLWLFNWGKKHGYPGISYQFGIKGYYFSHGVAEDTWIFIHEGYEHWECNCILGIEPHISRAVLSIQAGKISPLENQFIKPIFGGYDWGKEVIARLSLFSTARTSHGLHDTVRREALRNFAEERKYREIRYTSHKDGRSTEHSIEAGKDTWESFLEKATALEIYCAYVSTHADMPLSHFLAGEEEREV
jgi:hypothetical protein